MPGPPDVPVDPLEHRRRRHRRELPGDRAARLSSDDSQPALQFEVVDLYDDAVDLVVERLAPLLPGAAGDHDGVDLGVHLQIGAHLEAAVAKPFHRFTVLGELDPLERADRVGPHRERARGGELRIELADRAGGRVARICEGRLPGRGALLVELRERRSRQVGLAADLDQRRGIVDSQRYRLDRPQVLGHVLADLSIAAGGAALEDAVAVDERDREAVDLRLGDELDRGVLDAVLGEQPLRALQPGAQLLLVARVREREHRREVLDRGEALQRGRADALGRRFGGAQVGVLGLDVAQLVEQRVVVRIGDLRVVEDVVAAVVLLDLPSQRLGALRRSGGSALTHQSLRRWLWRDARVDRGRSLRAARRPSGQSGRNAAVSPRSGPRRSRRSRSRPHGGRRDRHRRFGSAAVPPSSSASSRLSR